jgi:hypothetical protein
MKVAEALEWTNLPIDVLQYSFDAAVLLDQFHRLLWTDASDGRAVVTT